MKWEVIFRDNEKSRRRKQIIFIVTPFILLIFDNLPSIKKISDFAHIKSYTDILINVSYWYVLAVATILFFTKVIIPQYLDTKKYSKLILVSVYTWIVIFFLAVAMAYFQQFVLNSLLCNCQDEGSLILTVFLANYYTLVINIPLSIFLMAFYFMQAFHHEQMHQTYLLKEKSENEISTYKRKWHPQYFLNSIHTLSNLSVDSNENQTKLILLFSNILSFILYDGSAETVKLDKEVEVAQELVEFENTINNRNITLAVHFLPAVTRTEILPLKLINPLIDLFIVNANNLNNNAYLHMYISNTDCKLMIGSTEYIQSDHLSIFKSANNQNSNL